MYGAPRMRSAAFKQEQIGYPQGKSSFIAPDSTPGPMGGKRSLSVGRKVYTWSDNPHRLSVPSCKCKGDGTLHPYHGQTPTASTGVTTYTVLDSNAGLYLDDSTGELVRTCAMGDDLLPRVATPAAPAAAPAAAGTPRAAAAAAAADRAAVEAERVARDAHIRTTIARITGRPFTGELTGAIRARFADFAEETRQLAEMGARALVTA